jgi:hypothetical protein
VFADGGLFANNPAVCALSEAASQLDKENVQLLDIACPRPVVKGVRDTTALGFVPQAVDLFLEAGQDAAEKICERALGSNYMCVEPMLCGASPALDDASESNLASLQHAGGEAYSKYADKLKEFIK